MRFESLKLTRYGRFTDQLIDFGSADGDLDFHVVFGPNEAGKSTLRSAAIDFMFGFPGRTAYNFLHANEALQVEGSVRAGDQLHQLTRIKRAKNSLLGPDNQPVAGDVFQTVLGDIGRDGYANMFSLDEDLLEAGGESILRSEGDLGELLFASASGLSALSTALGEVRAESEQFYKTGTRKHLLAGMKAELDALRSQIKDRDVLASQYDKLIKAQQTAYQQHADAVTERDQKAREKHAVKALLDCATPWFDYQQVQLRLTECGELPQLPASWLPEAEALAQTAAAGERSLADAQRAATRCTKIIDSIEVPTSTLAQGTRIDRLIGDDGEARYKASSDIASCERALQSLDEELQQLLGRLSAPSNVMPAELLLPAALQGRIKSLMEPRSRLDAELAAATGEAERAQREHSEVAQRNAAFEAVADLAALAEVLERVRDDGDDRDLQQVQRLCAEQQALIDSALTALAPWTGSVADLQSMSVAVAAELAELQQKNALLAERSIGQFGDMERLLDERARFGAQLSALADQEELVTDSDARDIRQAREAAWREHRAAIGLESIDRASLNTTADLVEAALGKDEQAASTRFSQAAAVATFRQVDAQLRQIDTQLERSKQKRVALDDELAEIAAQTAELCVRLGLPKATPLPAIDTWLVRREQLLGDVRKLAGLDAQRDALAQRTEQALAKLSEVMAALQLPVAAEDWRLSVKRADTALADWQKRKRRGVELANEVRIAERELTQRTEQQQRAQQDLQRWELDWTAALDGSWMSAERVLSAPEMAEVLQTLTLLTGALDKANSLRARIETMTADKSRYCAEVAEIAALLECSFDARQPLTSADELRAQLTAARENQRRHAEKSQELLQIAQDLEAAEVSKVQSDARFVQMNELFPAADFSALLASMRRSEERQQAQLELTRLRSLLTKLLLQPDFAEVEVLLGERLAAPDALEQLQQEHADLETTHAEQEKEVSSLYHEWRETQRVLDLIGDDAEVARLQERVRLLMLDIETQARRHIALSAGTLVVERALKTYLDSHRSSMLERASAAFAAVTQGAFTGLDATPIANREELMGIRADGSSLLATAMSRGTRFQLYLSLRIAGYHEFVQHRESLPFFADDILETFDDDRSAETFALMSEMSQTGQVIYLTHHRHLCELAKEVTQGKVKIHELAGFRK